MALLRPHAIDTQNLIYVSIAIAILKLLHL